MEMYDVVVVGSGTSGQTAAFQLKKKGLNVAVIEKADRPGGICALAGCQPKKWFYEATSRKTDEIPVETIASVDCARCGYFYLIDCR